MDVFSDKDQDTLSHSNDTKNPTTMTPLTKTDKRVHEIYLVVVSLFMVFIWFIIILVLAKFTLTDNNLVNHVFILVPPFIIIYHLFAQYMLVESSVYVEEEALHIIESMEKEKDFAKIIPSVVFGLGILLSGFAKGIYLMLPYFILVIIFGTLLPYFVLFINFSDNNVVKLIISEVLEYSSESYTFAFFIPAFFLLLRSSLEIHSSERKKINKSYSIF